MIKINCLSNETFEELQRAFKSETPVKNVDSMGYCDSVDVYISDEALLMYSKREVTIYFKGRLFRMIDIDFLSLEIE